MANGIFRKSLGILIFFIAFSFNSFSQKKGNFKQFSNEFPVFLSELGVFMKATENDKLKSVYNRFSKNSETLSVLEKSKIIDISNNMLSRRLKPSSHFSEFLLAIININNSQRGDVLLIDWLEVVFQMTEKTTAKKLLLFSRFTTNLVSKNVLRSSRSATWKISNTNFHFEFEMIEPIVVFENPFDLTCSSENGSYTIFDTKGKYYFVSTEWLGQNGVMNWESFSYSEDSVFALIDSYKLDTRKTQLIADSVAFYRKDLFLEPIIGRLVNKIAKGKQANSYPQFTSYSKNIELKEIFANIDYRGGYKIKGKEFIADGGEYAEARIVFRRNNKEIFIANANRFSIGSDRIVAQNSGVRIFFDNDSIYHANLQFKYIDSKRQLQLYRDVNGTSGAPMINTYHNVTMDFELLEWNIDTDIITFGSLPGSAESRVEFESVDRYLQSKFESMQGLDAIHPLLLVNNYVRVKNEEKFYVEDFARFAKFSMVQIEHYLMQLANDGFIFYDFAENRITVLPKLYNYVNAASDLGDYDILSFNSVIKPGKYKTKDRYLVNAALNLKTKDLNMLGINEISISKERGVYLFPKDGLVVIKKNRDFIFNGEIFAGRGRLNLFGRKFSFHYDEFKIDLNNIDSLQLSVPIQSIKKDMYDTEVLTIVKTVIEAVRGELRIDHPNNKSGIRKDFPEFPIFESFDDSYTYYDKKSIFNGVYDRDRFSFHLQPFKIDSLDNYTGEGLSFAGTFESAGIFPNFDDTLRLQEDYSLGFNRETPVNGFDIYRGKGRYYRDIHLSHKGLEGTGDFEYLNSKLTSNKILFFPDSTNLYTQSFIINEVEEGIEFPDVNNTDTYAHFEPYNDRLKIYKVQDEFNLYKSQVTFSGDLLMRPTGLTGKGVMSFDKAVVDANLFIYNANWFGSDTASLRVFEDDGLLAFKANDLKTHIDLLNREGLFYSNGSGSYVELFANQYISYIDKLIWQMDKEALILGEDLSNTKGSNFISIHPDQDSLSFLVKKASYSLKDYIVHANGVDSIIVADAIIYPDSGIVTIAKKAVIETLYAARILADNLTEYHTFTNATVDIGSAYNYKASGDYTYIDAMNKEQQIFFKEVSVDHEDTTTIAIGDITEDNLFHIDSQFDFKGSIHLVSDQKNLIFDGYFMINYDCNLADKEWVKFRSKIDPKDINITLEKNIYNDSEDLLFASPVMSFDSLNFYSTFLSKKKRSSLDLSMLTSSYNLYYNRNKSSYIVGGLDSLSSYYTLYDKTCNTKGEGIIDLNVDFGQFKLQSIGDIYHDMSSRNIETDGFLMLDFFFSEEAMKIMSTDLLDDRDELFEYDTSFAKNLSRVVGIEKAEVLLVDLEIEDNFSKFPDEMRYSIVLAKTKLKWDNNNKAYIGKGSFGISSILDQQVSSIVDGYVIIEKGKKSDVFMLYLETEGYEEYYFHYNNGVMQGYSTNPKFMAEINDVKEKNRVLERKKGSSGYRYTLANEDVTERFLKYVKKKY